MEIITPGLGLLFWMTISFLILVFILGRYAWKPIMKSLKDRETKIEEALHQADKAHEEMKQLKFSNEQLLKEAKEERDGILRDARAVRDKIIEEARLRASEEADRIVESARESIKYEKMEALTELKNQIALLSVEIAEKLVKKQLESDQSQKELIDKYLNSINFN